MGDFSVLLSVYAKENPCYLEMALCSIWHDQNLKPSQIVLVKDGALTQELEHIIDGWKKMLGPVFCIVSLSENSGLAAALNCGLEVCRYDLVARMDTDDISTPCRFEKQYKFFMDNPETSVCSGQIEEWAQDFSFLFSERKVPVAHDAILRFAKSRSPINHPAVMYRKSAVLHVGGYPAMYPEDYPLWVKMLMEGYKFGNLPDVILKMRVGSEFLKRRGWLFLKGEMRVYRYLYEINFIDFFVFVKNCSLRIFVRLSPAFVKSLLYKFFR